MEYSQCLVGPKGIEPLTSALKGRCSAGLSYSPRKFTQSSLEKDLSFSERDHSYVPNIFRSSSGLAR